MINEVKEEWKLIKINGNDKYEISSIGRVRNRKTGRILKYSLNKFGKPQVNMSINGKFKTRTIESLFCKEFFDFTVLPNVTSRTGKTVEYANGNYEDINENNLILPCRH